MTVVTRFAPSPTGRLHLGHAHAALFAWNAAREVGGRFLLRIEDIDPGRCRAEFVDGIFEDLEWLGLSWERPVRRQSEHLGDYVAALEKLDALGVLYSCFCTRAQIHAEIEAAAHAPHGPDGPLYPGTCRDKSDGERAGLTAQGLSHALRLDMKKAVALAGPLEWRDRARGVMQADPARFGDVVLARKDAPSSYHLAVTVDDALQGVTLVTRGEDLFEATHVHRLLQALLDLPVPEYHHHGLLAGPDGRRFAKRDRAPTLQALREDGKTPEDVRHLAGFPAG